MTDVAEILIHWYAGRSHSLGVDRKTIRKYLPWRRRASPRAGRLLEVKVLTTDEVMRPVIAQMRPFASAKHPAFNGSFYLDDANVRANGAWL